MFVYTIQPVVKPVGCLFTRYSRLSNGGLDNRLYRVNGVLQLHRQGLHTVAYLQLSKGVGRFLKFKIKYYQFCHRTQQNSN